MSTLPSVAQRLLRYVRYDTQSDPRSETYPSTEKQKVLLNVLCAELRDLGLVDAAIDEHGYVMASLPANVQKTVPVVGLIAHVDTSPEVSGANVNPQVHPDYRGGPIKLNETHTLTPEMAPLLRDHVGHAIITGDGTTLLGCDDKAGVAEIMALVGHLVSNPSVPHGELRIAFTPDEEIGNGTKFFDLRKFRAQYTYTVDGGKAGEVENETFCADAATITFRGINVHPGYAKDKLVSAIKAAARFVDLLPYHMSAEGTEGREGYIHPGSIEGGVEKVVLGLILRDFEEAKLKTQREILEDIKRIVTLAFPRVEIQISVQGSYRNMRSILDANPLAVDCAMEAVRRIGLQPVLKPIRGGTDGALLTYMGLPTPNLFTGAGLIHSCYEWIAVEDMEKAVQTLTNLVQVWVEKTS